MGRKYLAYFSIIGISIIFIFRLFYLQVLDNSYRTSPLNNSAVAVKYDYPKRGYIYDRNGELLVANQPSYDIMIIPQDVRELDTLEFCNLLKIPKEDFDFRNFFNAAPKQYVNWAHKNIKANINTQEDYLRWIK